MTTRILLDEDQPEEARVVTEVPSTTATAGSFGRLFGAAVASNLADGIGRTAVPLIALTLSDDPVAISIITALAFVPWLLFGIPAGVIVDRIDRRLAMATANGIRVLVAMGLTLAIATHSLAMPMLYVAVIAFGIGETLADNATNALIPAAVGSGSLDRANGRIQGAQIGIDHFVAMPIGGMLFGIAIAVPVVTAAGGYILAGLLALALPAAVGHGRRAPVGEPRAKVTAMEGVRYLLAHRYLRTMAIVTSVLGGLFQFGQATMLLAFVHLWGVVPAAFGFVAAGIGTGAVIGALSAPLAVARWGRGRVMLGGAILGTVGLGGAGLSHSLPVAMIAYSVGALGISAWNVPWGSLRQELIPDRLLGRVIGVMRTISWGLYPIATVLGGWVGRVSLRAPFVIGAAGALIITLIAARLFLSADRQVPSE